MDDASELMVPHVPLLTPRPFSVILLLIAKDTQSYVVSMYFSLSTKCKLYTVSRLISNGEFVLKKQVVQVEYLCI